MKKAKLIFCSLIAAAGLTIVPNLAHADPFNSGDIMDDGIFDNSAAMSASSIDGFLNGFSQSCISTNNGFSAPDPTGYSPSGGFTYGGNVSAGRVIADAAQAYDLNPQVILTTLQKEQSLVSGGAGCSTAAYTSALGYGCPDSGTTHSYSGVNLYTINGTTVTSVSNTCVNNSTKAGFSQQIIHAAWLLKFSEQRAKGNVNWAIVRGSWNNSDDNTPGSCYSGPMTQGTWQVCVGGPSAFYDGTRTIDGQTVQIGNGATAALYYYTPHFSGNQHFDSIFNSWFGSQFTPSYSWQVLNQAVYTDNTKTTLLGWNANLVAGQTAYVVLTVKNTGNQTWSNTGANPVHLATSGPQDRNSLFCTNAWLSCNRAVATDEATVAPGATGTFEFPVQAPGAGGYREYFNLVAEGRSWFNSAGQYFTFNVQPPTWSWAEVNQTVYTDNTKANSIGWNTGNLVSGQKVYVVITALNTGNQTWSNTGANPIDIGTWNGQDRSSGFTSGWLSSNRPAGMTESSVPPGSLGSFGFWMQAPAQGGNYREYFNLVAEGKAWMNPTGMFVASTVNAANYSWQPLGQTVFTDSTKTTALGWNATLTHGQTAWIVMSVKNTGNVTWDKVSAPLVHVGTWNPQDRNSLFCTNAWLSCNRAVGFSESSVPPGGTATFEFPVQAPVQPGNYNEYFNLVAEGKAWMNPTGMFVHFTVQ